MLHRLVPFGFPGMSHSLFVLDLVMRRVLSLLCRSLSLVLVFCLSISVIERLMGQSAFETKNLLHNLLFQVYARS